MATSGVDKRVKVFDLRSKKMLNSTHIAVGASSLAFSQRGLLASALGSRVQVSGQADKHTDVQSDRWPDTQTKDDKQDAHTVVTQHNMQLCNTHRRGLLASALSC